jgi:hypothetical protein
MLVASLVLGLLPGSANAASVYTAQAAGKGAQILLGDTEPFADQTAPRVADTDRLPAAPPPATWPPKPNGDGVADCKVSPPGADPDQCRTGPKVEDIIGIPLLANVLSAGVAAQDAFVTDGGNSGACAGLVGAGGLISIDETPQGCIVANPTNPGGVYINLIDGIPLTLYRVRLDVAYAQCSATAGNPEALPPVPPSAAGTSHVANLVVEQVITVPLVGDIIIPILTLPVDAPLPNSQVFPPPPPSPFDALKDLVSIRANEQTAYNAAGVEVPVGSPTTTRIDVTALHIRLLGPATPTGLLDLKFGQVSCGTNTAQIVSTTTSSTSSSTSTTGPTSSTTSTVPGTSSTTSTVPGTSSTTSSTSSTSSTSTTFTIPPPVSSSTSSTTSTLPPPIITTSTTAAPGTSSTSSTSSTVLAAASTSTTKAKAPLVKTGANTRAQLSLALGLLGLGFVVTGRGMQLGFAGPDRRRRR